MSSLYMPSPMVIDPFVLHFLASTMDPPPPLPSALFFYDPFLIVPPPPPAVSSPPVTDSEPSQAPAIKVLLSNRHRYTPVQLFTLHRLFLQVPYPTLSQRRLIAQHLNIDVYQVRFWFSNRRSRKRATSHPTNLVQPTSTELIDMKTLFHQLNLPV